MKVLTFARRIAHEEGIKPARNWFLEFVIWERTGYPCFWQGDWQQCFEAQLREAFQDIMKQAEACKDGAMVVQ